MAYVGYSTVYFKYKEDDLVDIHVMMEFDEIVEQDILDIQEKLDRQKRILKDQLITLLITPFQIVANLFILNFKQVKFLLQIEVITIKDLFKDGCKRLFYKPKASYLEPL